jgi:integrase
MAAMTKARSVPIAELGEELERHYTSKGVSAGTLGQVRRVVRMFGDIGVAQTRQLDDDAIGRFQAAIPSSLAERSRAALLRRARAILNLAVKWGLLGSMPKMPAIPAPEDFANVKPISSPPRSDVKKLLDHLLADSGRSWEAYRIYALAAVIVYAGLRRDEALRLKVADVDLAGGVIWIRRRQGMRWTRLPDAIRMSADLRAILGGWLRRADSEWVFPGKSRTGPWHQIGGGGRKRKSSALAHLKAAGRAAGIGPITFRELRQFHLDNAVLTVSLGDRDPATRSESTRSGPGPDPAVEIGEPGEPVVVNGVLKDPLTPAQYRIIKAMRDVFPGGLSKKGMTQIYGGEAWRQILIRLRKDADWASAIGFPGVLSPGKETGLYRILPV